MDRGLGWFAREPAAASRQMRRTIEDTTHDHPCSGARSCDRRAVVHPPAAGIRLVERAALVGPVLLQPAFVGVRRRHALAVGRGAGGLPRQVVSRRMSAETGRVCTRWEGLHPCRLRLAQPVSTRTERTEVRREVPPRFPAEGNLQRCMPSRQPGTRHAEPTTSATRPDGAARHERSPNRTRPAG